jgi:hypothetical protein
MLDYVGGGGLIRQRERFGGAATQIFQHTEK